MGMVAQSRCALTHYNASAQEIEDKRQKTEDRIQKIEFRR